MTRIIIINYYEGEYMKSFWNWERENYKEFESLSENTRADVCVIGAGFTGLLTAYYLSKEGKKVIVLEKDRICSHTSLGTTGKVTSQHGLIYKYLKDSEGKEFAKKYFKANESAIKNTRKIIEEENIECDFEEKSAYVYTQSKEDLQKIKDEVKVSKELGIPSEFVQNIDLPFDILGAIEFKNQAQFHPLKYAYGISKSIIKNGGKIFENSKVIDVIKKDDNYIIQTDNSSVTSKYVVVATRYPIITFPGYYFVKMYQSTSYAMIFDTKTDFNTNGIFINTENPQNSFRSVKYKDKNLLLAVGYDQRTGSEIVGNPYEYLKSRVKNIFPDAEEIEKWSAEDCISLDKIPYIGDFSKIMDNVYVATGFNKWGITSSNVAANIIKDKILNIENEYEDIFRSSRLEIIKNKDEVMNMMKESADGIVVKRLKTVQTPTCTHLGCKLSWNEIEQTWDCSCHGSRFTKDGEVLETPALKNIDEI